MRYPMRIFPSDLSLRPARSADACEALYRALDEAPPADGGRAHRRRAASTPDRAHARRGARKAAKDSRGAADKISPEYLSALHRRSVRH